MTSAALGTIALSALGAGASTKACELYRRDPCDLPTLARRLGFDEHEVTARVADARRWADEMARTASRNALDLIAPRTEHYPERLWEIVDPPLALWSRGQASLASRTVAIVGSRRATPAGLIVARQLGTDLTAAGWTVVSGMALGVDGAAHEAALDAGGETIAVLGCGADVVYPRSHRRLAARIVENGRILSEFPPGSPPLPWRFPLRNRIISGLSRAVIVIEASEKSGSLITARLAMEQGRDVLAVPGCAPSGRYRGSHALIKDGARLVETVDDVLDELEGVSRERRPKAENKRLPISQLEATMAIGSPYTADELSARTGRPVQDLLAELGTLEVQGRVSRVGGGNFVRT